MHKRSCLSKPFGSECVNESQKLLKSTFIVLSDHFEWAWVGKIYFQSDLTFEDCLLTGWLLSMSILIVIGTIYCYQLNAIIWKIRHFFVKFFMHFWNLHSILNILKKRKELHSSSVSEVIDSKRCAYLNA